MAESQLLPGDWILTFGRAPWWRVWQSVPYAAMRAYARRKYPPALWNPRPVTEGTHVRLVIDHYRLFEVTVPRARFTTCAESELAEKFAAGLVRVARFPLAPIDPVALRTVAMKLDGTPYDYGDLADFAISGWLGLGGVIRLFGDRAKRYMVCSTGAAFALSYAGLELPVGIETVDPNGPLNGFGLRPSCANGQPWEPLDITARLTPKDFQ